MQKSSGIKSSANNTLSFDIEHIKTLQDQLNNIIYDMTITSENTIEQLYIEINDLLYSQQK